MISDFVIGVDFGFCEFDLRPLVYGLMIGWSDGYVCANMIGYWCFPRDCPSTLKFHWSFFFRICWVVVWFGSTRRDLLNVDWAPRMVCIAILGNPQILRISMWHISFHYQAPVSVMISWDDDFVRLPTPSLWARRGSFWWLGDGRLYDRLRGMCWRWIPCSGLSSLRFPTLNSKWSLFREALNRKIRFDPSFACAEWRLVPRRRSECPRISVLGLEWGEAGRHSIEVCVLLFYNFIFYCLRECSKGSSSLSSPSGWSLVFFFSLNKRLFVSVMIRWVARIFELWMFNFWPFCGQAVEHSTDWEVWTDWRTRTEVNRDDDLRLVLSVRFLYFSR